MTVLSCVCWENKQSQNRHLTMSEVLLGFLQQVQRQRDRDARITRAVELIKAKMPHPTSAHCKSSQELPMERSISL